MTSRQGGAGVHPRLAGEGRRGGHLPLRYLQDGGRQPTISCKGLKTDFVDQLTQALEKAIQLVKDKTGTATEPADPEFDFDMPEGSGTLDSLLELFRSLKPDDFSVELDVNMDGQVLAVRAKATVLQNRTEEGDHHDLRDLGRR